MKIVALAGGVGGAKLADGLALILQPGELTVVVNTGDDFEHYGLKISPDLDTVCYTLAGISNPATGWGREGESWRVLAELEKLGGETWFRLGDLDLATHLERTLRLKKGDLLTEITRDFCRKWGIRHTILPMSDDTVSTIVITENEQLSFQEYFVHRHFQPVVKSFVFEHIQDAKPADGVLEAIGNADMVVICPSNPWVSIDPIVSLPGVREVMKNVPVVAVSPIIGGTAVKGPAAKMFQELGIVPSAFSVAEHYKDFLDGFVIDEIDAKMEEFIQAMGIRTLVTQTLMKNRNDREQLASEIMAYFIDRLVRRIC